MSCIKNAETSQRSELASHLRNLLTALCQICLHVDVYNNYIQFDMAARRIIIVVNT